MKPILNTALLSGFVTFASCNNPDTSKTQSDSATTKNIQENAVTYALDTLTMKGFVTYDLKQPG